MRPRTPWCVAVLGAAAVVAGGSRAHAHNPIFTPGPHVTYEGGLEVTLGYERDRTSGAGRTETGQAGVLELEYGITADWAMELEAAVLDRQKDAGAATGLGDIALRSRYRFHRRDTFGVQRSAALLVQINLPTGDDDTRPPLGTGSTDVMAGLLYGREGRRWYYNAAARYRFNSEGAGGLKKGDRQFLDLVGGVRPVLTGYREPDTVVFLEMNWENAGRDEIDGAARADSGGWELFLSPGVFWTVRNVAVRAGVQIPVARGLNGDQASSDYRIKVQFRYQF